MKLIDKRQYKNEDKVEVGDLIITDYGKYMFFEEDDGYLLVSLDTSQVISRYTFLDIKRGLYDGKRTEDIIEVIKKEKLELHIIE